MKLKDKRGLANVLALIKLPFVIRSSALQNFLIGFLLGICFIFVVPQINSFTNKPNELVYLKSSSYSGIFILESGDFTAPEANFSKGAERVTRSPIWKSLDDILKSFPKAPVGLTFSFLISILISPFVLSAWLWKQSQPETHRDEIKFSHVVESFSENNRNEPDANNLQKEHIYTGWIVAPKRVYEGDSQNIQVSFELFDCVEQIECLEEGEQESSHPTLLKKENDTDSTDFLEVNFLASGFDVDGEKKQKQNLSLSFLPFRWNCYFPNSGSHSFILTLKLTPIDDSDLHSSNIWIGDIEGRVKVIRFGGLTKLQMSQFSLLSSIIGLIIGITSLPSLIQILPKIAELLK